MRYAILAVLLVMVGAGLAEARERPLQDLPADVWQVAALWTEPLRAVARDARRFDPISGLWFGLLEGSVKSMQRTADFVLSSKRLPGNRPRDPRLFLRYTF